MTITIEQFMQKVAMDDSGCWLWQGGRYPKGYGVVCFAKQNWSAHRVAYELFVGRIPAGLQIDHLCRVRHCVNPEHLEPVTLQENNRRSQSPSGRNARKTHCIQGHEFTPENTRITSRGHRRCRICNRLEKRAWGRQRRARGWGAGSQSDPPVSHTTGAQPDSPATPPTRT